MEQKSSSSGYTASTFRAGATEPPMKGTEAHEAHASARATAIDLHTQEQGFAMSAEVSHLCSCSVREQGCCVRRGLLPKLREHATRSM